jgi:HAD superfamily hydrolase (TIGR01549 family)
VDYDRTEAAALAAVYGEYFYDSVLLDDFRAAFAVRNDELWAAYRRHELSLDVLRTERFAGLLAACPPSRPVTVATVAARFERELGCRVRLFPDSVPALRALRACARLVLVTDGIAAVQHAKLAATRLRELFTEVVVSSETGLRKPDPAVLRHALSRAGADRAAALMVGDSPGTDGGAAVAAGMDFCWVRRRGRPARPAATGLPEPAGVPAPVTLCFRVPDLATLAAWLCGGGVRSGQPGLAALPAAG